MNEFGLPSTRQMWGESKVGYFMKKIFISPEKYSRMVSSRLKNLWIETICFKNLMNFLKIFLKGLVFFQMQKSFKILLQKFGRIFY